jgi:hypothetical protein
MEIERLNARRQKLGEWARLWLSFLATWTSWRLWHLGDFKFGLSWRPARFNYYQTRLRGISWHPSRLGHSQDSCRLLPAF